MTTAIRGSVFYLDSSALVKRYLAEQGSDRITALCLPTDNTIITARITKAEIASAMGRKHRLGELARSNYTVALQDLSHHFNHEYIVAEVDEAVVDLAVRLTTRQKLRGYDAVQLATALTINASFTHANLPPITFVAADSNLLQAAQSEGLRTENPSLLSPSAS